MKKLLFYLLRNKKLQKCKCKFKMKKFVQNREFDFSEENIKSLSESIYELKKTMRKVGTSIGSKELNNILASAMKNDFESFRIYALSNELFGGAGALWELYCGNDKIQVEFQNRFEKFCIELKKNGIKNSRVNEILKSI